MHICVPLKTVLLHAEHICTYNTPNTHTHDRKGRKKLSSWCFECIENVSFVELPVCTAQTDKMSWMEFEELLTEENRPNS